MPLTPHPIQWTGIPVIEGGTIGSSHPPHAAQCDAQGRTGEAFRDGVGTCPTNEPEAPTAGIAVPGGATPYDLVTGERQADYDHPLDNLGQTADLWTAQFTRKLAPGATFTPEDVCLAMILLKTSRESFKHKDDNLVDIHGYAHCLTMIREERDRRSTV